MSTYWDEVRKLPIPSEEQILAFVDYVARSHSWYKHLPLMPPGSPFHFFVDPNVGCDLVVRKGHPEYRLRKARGFHYSDLPTAEYRQRFGYLQYSARAGTSILVPRDNGTLVVSSDRKPISVSTGARIRRRLARWFRPAATDLPADVEDLIATQESETSSAPAIQVAGKVYSVPEEILAAGRVELTGIIHPCASEPWLWQPLAACMEKLDWAKLKWPEETGGQETLLHILRFVRENPGVKSVIRELHGHQLLFFSEEIHSLVEPERQRLKKLMKEAICRMLALIYGVSECNDSLRSGGIP